MSLRVGRIAALNMFPIYFGLEARGDGLRFTDGVPTALNDALLAGRLDVSAVSSVAYARNADRLALVPVASITAAGAADSIQLFSRVPLTRVETIAVTPHSATSVVLLRLLLGSDRPPFRVLEVSPRKALREVDAVLLIGDEALAGLRARIAPFNVDLAEFWHDQTGLPMVFAVWAARLEVARSRPEAIGSLADLIRDAQRGFHERPDAVVEAAAQRFPFPAEFIRKYFGGLSYEFGEVERAGLAHFLDRAGEAGLLRAPAAPEGVGSGR